MVRIKLNQGSVVSSVKFFLGGGSFGPMTFIQIHKTSIQRLEKWKRNNPTLISYLLLFAKTDRSMPKVKSLNSTSGMLTVDFVVKHL